MGRTKGSTLAVVGNLRRVIKPHEDWDEIDGFLIISSAFPFRRRGGHEAARPKSTPSND